MWHELCAHFSDRLLVNFLHRLNSYNLNSYVPVFLINAELDWLLQPAKLLTAGLEEWRLKTCPEALLTKCTLPTVCSLYCLFHEKTKHWFSKYIYEFLKINLKFGVSGRHTKSPSAPSWCHDFYLERSAAVSSLSSCTVCVCSSQMLHHSSPLAFHPSYRFLPHRITPWLHKFFGHVSAWQVGDESENISGSFVPNWTTFLLLNAVLCSCRMKLMVQPCLERGWFAAT